MVLSGGSKDTECSHVAEGIPGSKEGNGGRFFEGADSTHNFLID